MDVINGKKAVVKIEISEGDNYGTLTDDDVVTYSLYDMEGNIVYNIEDESVDIDSLEDKTMIYIEIPEEANVIETGKTFDNRLLIVDYTLEGNPHSQRQSYRIIPFVPYSCSPNNVRNLLGVSDTVIDDTMIDVYSAYLKCKSLFENPSLLDSILIEGSSKTTDANRAIAICGALSFRSSLPLLTPKIESDSVVSQTRFTMTVEDFNALFDALEDELSELLAELQDISMDDMFSPDLFVVGNLTDTFTGS